MHEAQRVQRHLLQILDMSLSAHARRQVVAWCSWARVPVAVLADVCMQERRYITSNRPWWHGGQRDTGAIVVSGCWACFNVTVFSSARLATIAIGSPTHVQTRLHGHRLQNPHRNTRQKPGICRRKLRSLPTRPIPRHHESHVTANTI